VDRCEIHNRLKNAVEAYGAGSLVHEAVAELAAYRAK
jgi:hypothetical protein